MDDVMRATLREWDSFYLTTGSAAASLTGLQFVVMTLIASASYRAGTTKDQETSTAAFGTPTVVHLSLALLLSTVLAMPWPGINGLRETVGALGAVALVYSVIVFRRATRVRNYEPVLEDWVWHIILPAAAYTAVLIAAVAFSYGTTIPLFAIAAATLLLIFVGIHNAWDTVTYLTARATQAMPEKPPAAAAPAERADTGDVADA